MLACVIVSKYVWISKSSSGVSAPSRWCRRHWLGAGLERAARAPSRRVLVTSRRRCRRPAAGLGGANDWWCDKESSPASCLHHRLDPQITEVLLYGISATWMDDDPASTRERVCMQSVKKIKRRQKSTCCTPKNEQGCHGLLPALSTCLLGLCSAPRSRQLWLAADDGRTRTAAKAMPARHG